MNDLHVHDFETEFEMNSNANLSEYSSFPGMHYLLNFDVRIPKLFTSRDENGNVHTEYVITVCTNLSVWNVCRKIHNFTELHDTLSKQFPQVQLPKLPLKNSNQRRHTLDSTKARSVSVTEIKRAELEVYLLSLISIHDIWISAAFVEFFDDSPAPSLGMQIQFTAVSNQVLCLKQGQSDIENRLATTENMLSSALQLIQELELRLGKEEVHCAHAAPLSGPAQLLPITQPSYMKPSSDPYVWSSLKRASMLGGVHENDITSTAYSKVDRNDRNVEESGSHVLGRALSSTDSPGNGMITTSMGSVNGYMSPPLLIDDSSVPGSRISADLRFYQRRPSGSAVSSNNNTSGLLRKNDEVHCDTEEEKIANRSSLKYHRTPSVTSGPTQLVSVEEEIGCQDRAQIEVEESKKDSEATLSSPFGTTARYIAPVDMSDVLDAVLRLNCKSNSNDNNHVNSGTNTHATNMKSSVFSLFKVVEDDVDVVPTTMELSDAPPLPTYFDDDRFPLASPTPYSFEEYSLGLDQMLELLHVASLYSVGEPSLCYQNGLDTSNNMISARINLIAFMEKHIRKVVSSKVFAVGLSTSLHCLLPDDSIELTALLWKGSESSWVGVVYEYFSRLFGQLYTHGSYIDSIVSSIQLTAATEQKLDKMQKNLLLPLPIAHPSVQMDQALEANISNSFSSVSTPIVSINGSKEEEEKQHDWEEFCEDIRHASLVYSKYACRLVEVDGNSLLRFQFDDIVVNFAPNSRKDMCMTAFIQQFSEKVGKNELFKRSMLLIRAWWKYEVPTYFGGMNTTLHEYLSNDALVVMLCAIFNMYNDRLKDPLQVMTAFFFEYGGGLKDEVSSSYNDNERHRFDWNTSVVTLQGPVPIEDFNFSAPPVGCVKPWHVADDALLMKYSNMYNDKGLVYVSTWSSSNSNTAVVPPEDATFPVTSSLSNVDICENEENLVTASPTHSARHSANNVNTIAPACYYGPHEPCPRREINIIHPLHPSINMIPSADTLSQLNPAGGLHTALKFVFDTAFEKFRNTIEIPSNPPNATDANANVGLKLPVDFFPNTIGRFGSPYVHLFTNKGLMCEDGDVSGGVSGTYSSLHTPSPFSFINSKNQSSSNSNTTSRRNSLKPQMNPVAKQPNSLSLANALEAAGDAPDVSELPEDASFIVRFKSYGQRLKKLTALRSVNTPRMLLCTDCAYKTLIDWFGVAVSAIEAWDQVQYANLMLKGYVTDSSLWSLCCDVLIDRGFMPVGEIGKLLQELTMSVSFSTILKDKYGGLKKFLEMFPEDFYLSGTHPFNPQVFLCKTLTAVEIENIESKSEIPTLLLLKHKKRSSKKKKANGVSGHTGVEEEIHESGNMSVQSPDRVIPGLSGNTVEMLQGFQFKIQIANMSRGGSNPNSTSSSRRSSGTVQQMGMSLGFQQRGNSTVPAISMVGVNSQGLSSLAGQNPHSQMLSFNSSNSQSTPNAPAVIQHHGRGHINSLMLKKVHSNDNIGNSMQLQENRGAVAGNMVNINRLPQGQPGYAAGNVMSNASAYSNSNLGMSELNQIQQIRKMAAQQQATLHTDARYKLPSAYNNLSHPQPSQGTTRTSLYTQKLSVPTISKTISQTMHACNVANTGAKLNTNSNSGVAPVSKGHQFNLMSNVKYENASNDLSQQLLGMPSPTLHSTHDRRRSYPSQELSVEQESIYDILNTNSEAETSLNMNAAMIKSSNNNTASGDVSSGQDLYSNKSWDDFLSQTAFAKANSSVNGMNQGLPGQYSAPQGGGRYHSLLHSNQMGGIPLNSGGNNTNSNNQEYLQRQNYPHFLSEK